MIFWEIIRLAFASLGANKLRSSLTMLGITIGIFTVIGVMTAVSAMRAQIESGLSFLGVNSFQVQKYPALNFSNPRWRYGNRRDIDYPMATRFRELLEGQARVSLLLQQRNRRVLYGDRYTNPNIEFNGADEFFVESFNFEIASGRNLTAEDVTYARPVAVIGDDLRVRLFPNEEPVGQTIRVDGQNLEVVGRFVPKGTSFGQSQDNFVLTPITRWMQAYGRARRSISVNVQAPSAEALLATCDAAIGAMRLARGLDPEDPNDFELFSNESLIETFNNIAGMVAAGAFLISAIALLAAGVGVMNIMLVSVTERTKEIGIRKSLGARKRNILVQFMIEAVTLSLVGGLAGVALGILGGNIVAWKMNVDLVFPVGWAVTGFVVCSVVGIGFGLYPAWKAANLSPIEALRQE
jgi:putative ABC transport system permease protein